MARIEGAQGSPRARPTAQGQAGQGAGFSGGQGAGFHGGQGHGGQGGQRQGTWDAGSPPRHSAEEVPSSPEQEREEEEVVGAGTGSGAGGAKKVKKRLSVGKVFGFGKLNYAMKGIIDVDPETTRRNNIGKTKEAINQVPPPRTPEHPSIPLPNPRTPVYPSRLILTSARNLAPGP